MEQSVSWSKNVDEKVPMEFTYGSVGVGNFWEKNTSSLKLAEKDSSVQEKKKDTSVTRFFPIPGCQFSSVEKDSSVFKQDSSVLLLWLTQLCQRRRKSYSFCYKFR